MIRVFVVVLAIVSMGCAHRRDWSRVEPGLATGYRSSSAPANAVLASQAVPVVPVQQPVVQAVPQQQPAPQQIAIPQVASNQVVAPPASSTGQQPYYQPSPNNVVVAGAQVPTNPGVGAGVYPVTQGVMWSSVGDRKPVVMPKFATETTGSGFVPRDPGYGAAGGTGSSSTNSVVTAGAVMPFNSQIPVQTPPAQNSRPAFISETNEHLRPSQIPTKTATPNPLPNNQADPMPPSRPRIDPAPPGGSRDIDIPNPEPLDGIPKSPSETPSNSKSRDPLDGFAPQQPDLGKKVIDSPAADPPKTPPNDSKGRVGVPPAKDEGLGEPLPPVSTGKKTDSIDLPKKETNTKSPADDSTGGLLDLPPPPLLPDSDTKKSPTTDGDKKRVQSDDDFGSPVPPPKGI